MQKPLIRNLIFFLALLLACTPAKKEEKHHSFKPFEPPVSYEDATKKADDILAKLTIDDKIDLIGGHNAFFVKGLEEYNIPELYLSDATQGVHIRKHLDNRLEKSVAFPAPIALTATWNPELAGKYAKSIGEECRAGGIAVLLGPGMNHYRISQNGRNFEYFGEDPFLASRMIENYVVGMQSTGTITTLKHFILNNTDYKRRGANAIVDERTLHELYLPAFKAGIDAGAMAVMTSYNLVNGEWAGQSKHVITDILRNDLGFKWLVMSDWWSTWDPEKTIKSGLDLEMPGHAIDDIPQLKIIGDVYVRTNAKRLLEEGKVEEADINRMAKNILTTEIAMGLQDRPIKDDSYLKNYPQHEEVALQTGREGIVLLRNENGILPLDKEKTGTILITGDNVDKTAFGGGSAEVEGYDRVTKLQALKEVYGDKLVFEKSPSDKQLTDANVVILSIGTFDSEGSDRPFALPAAVEDNIKHIAALNPNTIVVVNSGGGIKMTDWNTKVAAILYAWYPGQLGNKALAEIISGKTSPSGKLPISIEKRFEDSPGFPYIPKGEELYSNWEKDIDPEMKIYDIVYKEGVFTGYRWYESKKIEPLYPFGFGLSYTTFEFSDLEVTEEKIDGEDHFVAEFTITNTGDKAGAEVAQLYINDVEASVPRPEKELKGFKKVYLEPGESQTLSIPFCEKALSFWDIETHDWKAEPGEFKVLIGSASNDIHLEKTFALK